MNIVEHCWSGTVSGKKFFYDDRLETSVVDPEDVAHHLSQIARYGGATLYPYWVSQHSRLISDWLWSTTGDPHLAMDALWHDAPEYVIGDMRSMLKPLVPAFMGLELRVTNHIRRAMQSHGVPPEEYDRTKHADKRIRHDEWLVLMQGEVPPSIAPYAPLGVEIEQETWDVAKQKWLDAFHSLAQIIANRDGRTAAYVLAQAL